MRRPIVHFFWIVSAVAAASGCVQPGAAESGVPGVDSARADSGVDSAADTDSATDTGDSGGAPPPSRLYLTLVSHNETRGNAPCNRVLVEPTDLREAYLANRSATVALVDVVRERGAALDFQSDWLYLERVREYDVTAAVTADTGGMDLIRWLSEVDPAHIVVDAHSHEKAASDGTSWNYADVQRALQGFGVPDSGVVGGFLAHPPADADWERFKDGLADRDGWVWRPSLLWGGASSGHDQDGVAEAAGVWHPLDAGHYTEDDPDSPLAAIGPWTGRVLDVPSILSLLAVVRAGPPGRLYTASMVVLQCDLDLPGEVAEVAEAITALQPEVATGDLVWATLPAVARVHQDVYGGRGWVYTGP